MSVVDKRIAQLTYRAVVQDIRPRDWRASPLLFDLHAVLVCRDAEELPAVRVPLCEFRGADDAGGQVREVLEVRRKISLVSTVYAGYIRKASEAYMNEMWGNLRRLRRPASGNISSCWRGNANTYLSF